MPDKTDKKFFAYKFFCEAGVLRSRSSQNSFRKQKLERRLCRLGEPLRNSFFLFLTAVMIFVFDRFSKLLVSKSLFIGEEIIFIKGIINFTKIFNTGAAFGILKNQNLFLLGFSFLVILSLFIYVIRTNKKLNIFETLGIGMIMGGVAGNLFDRIYYGHVVDFIKLCFVNFPIFNTADLFINTGVIFIF